ncbi:OprD family outer membrane porin [Endozoicomonas sp.]|uniref:OprD family outer membrane porin n=1 Tax=Endozoicomonas sp. TaxID=1892382 RepID=UPI003AF6E37C
MNYHNVRTPPEKPAPLTSLMALAATIMLLGSQASKAAEALQNNFWHYSPENINAQYTSGHFISFREYSPNYSPTSSFSNSTFSVTPIRLTVSDNPGRDPVSGAELSFQHHELGSRLAYAENDSDIRYYFANLNYLVNLSDHSTLLLDGQFYRGQESSTLKSSTQPPGSFDTEANLYNINAQLTINQLSLSASFSQVDAQKKHALGVFDYSAAHPLSPDTQGSAYWTRRQISDFNFNGEKVWQAGIAYNFHHIGAPGLTLGYTYTYGNDIKTNHPEFTEKYRESEHNFEVGYLFQKPQLKGLGLKLQYAQYLADKALSEISSSENETPAGNGNTDLRVYLDYSVTIF